MNEVIQSPKKCESGPYREPTLSAMRSRADSLRQHAKQLIARANGLDALAAVIEEVKRVSLASAAPGCESSIPYIGEGSDADHALWLLVVNSKYE